MEYRIATSLLGLGREKTKTNKNEPYSDPDPGPGPPAASPGPSPVELALIVAEIVFYLLIGSFSAYLSWSSNASIGWHPLFCFLFAVVAFVCAFLYIFSHALFKLDMLAAVRSIRLASTTLPTPSS